MEDYAPEAVVARLAPLVTPERLERMRSVLAGRSGHVAFVFERMIDPHNFSAALRSLDAFGFQDVHLVQPGDRLDLSRNISIGADRWLSLHQPVDSAACVAGLHAQGYRVLASHVVPHAETPDLTELDFSEPVALVFGNEHAGVGAELLDLADGRFRIGMRGFVESLNLSVSVAVSAWQVRQELSRLQAAALQRGAPEDAARYGLPPARQEALLAQWLRRSFRYSDAILAGMDPEAAIQAGRQAAKAEAAAAERAVEGLGQTD